MIGVSIQEHLYCLPYVFRCHLIQYLGRQSIKTSVVWYYLIWFIVKAPSNPYRSLIGYLDGGSKSCIGKGGTFFWSPENMHLCWRSGHPLDSGLVFVAVRFSTPNEVGTIEVVVIVMAGTPCCSNITEDEVCTFLFCVSSVPWSPFLCSIDSNWILYITAFV